jgi:tight adherence protein B
MRISKSVGGNLSETLINLGNAIQLKLIIEGKIKSLTAQGVMQAWTMSLLPAFVAVALTFIQPEQMDKLFSTLTGNVVLAACLLMDYIGFKVIKKILTIDV